MKKTFTHKGWLFVFVPVLIADIETDCPALAARHPLLEWLFPVGEAVFSCYVTVAWWFNPEYEPMFPIRVTGRIPEVEI